MDSSKNRDNRDLIIKKYRLLTLSARLELMSDKSQNLISLFLVSIDFMLRGDKAKIFVIGPDLSGHLWDRPIISLSCRGSVLKRLDFILLPKLSKKILWDIYENSRSVEKPKRNVFGKLHVRYLDDLTPRLSGGTRESYRG